ncbi:MAG: 30S ribosomal protein S13 [Planctomycetales bacterium]|nr:30S ribosomal protein S13 [Planctomycetales bacterium]
MPRVAGVDIPSDRRIVVALTYIHGIGRRSARKILAACQIDENTRAKDVPDEALARIVSHIEKNYMVEGQLKRQVALNITRLKEIKCYRGLRHRAGLPCRGQRTRRNARTRKGPRRTVAVRKAVKARH